MNAIVTGNEWVCMPGFSQDGKTCERLMPPANGYVQGNEIKCANGFAMQKDETCARVIGPANAFLAGHGWRCRAGFAREGDSCIALVVPANSDGTGSKTPACEQWFPPMPRFAASDRPAIPDTGRRVVTVLPFRRLPMG